MGIIFSPAGAEAAFLNDPTHFNQNYRWSFECLAWRGDLFQNK